MLEVDLPALDPMLVQPPAMLARLLLPSGDGPLIEAEGGDDGLQGTAMGEQGQHGGDHVVSDPLAVERGATGGGEGPSPGRTEITLLGATLHADVALSGQPPCGTVEVVAELALRVHRWVSQDWFGDQVWSDA